MSKAGDKAAKKALEKFPILFGERMGYDKTNLQQERRNAYEKGYHQAEKDLELTWEDLKLLQNISHEVFAEVAKGNVDYYQIYPTEQSFLEEVLKRFKDFKERKQQ